MTVSPQLGIIPSSMMNFFIYIASFVASAAAMYFASVVESVVVSYLELFQLTTPPFRVNTYPELDLLASQSD